MSRLENASSRRALQPPTRWLRTLLVLVLSLLLSGGCAAPPSHGDDERVGSAEQAIAVQAPTITSFTPATGAQGATVTVTGTNLAATTSVTFDGTASAQVTGVTATQLQAVVPAGATTGTIAVTTPSGTATSAKSFGVLPTISGFTPASGAPGDMVSISGTGFIGTTGVELGKIAVAFTFESDVLIMATVPVGALTATFSVTKASGTATSAASFLVAPTITSFTPASGIQGTSVTVKGTNLLDASAVSFGGIPATIISTTATTVVATVPVGSSTGTIAVTTPGGTTTSANAFDVVPTLDGFTPLDGPVGTTVTLTGTGFLGASVAFGTVAATTTTVTDTTITTTVPATAATGKITVTTAGGSAKSAGTFTVVVAPTIKSFSPTSGPPGTTTVGIKGTGFDDLTAVSFGGVPSTDFTVTSDTAATAIVPGLAVTGTVTVTNAAGSATSTGVFTVIGQNPCAGVTCVAQDQCHVAGTCSGGVCSNPTATDGTACNDGNACTQTDTCQSGACTGSNPVTCTAQDPCHVAGSCDPTSGQCSNPAAANGTACNDGNVCTQTDTCQAGACVGGNPVICVAQDQCHAAGTCSGKGGGCSNPTLPDGSPCNDGIACTDNDVCTGGSCAGTAYSCSAPGAPSFATSEYLPVSQWLSSYGTDVVVKDVNGDGHPDVVVSAGYGIAVFLGNGDGTLQPGAPFTSGSGGNGLVIVDVNGDGILDAVTFQGVNGVMVFLGNGDGTFGYPIISPTIATLSDDDTWLDVGDLNGDGKPDAVVIHTNESTLAVLLGNGDGTFQAETDYPGLGFAYPGSEGFVKLADFNRDGHLDALVGNVNGSSVSVLLGNGDGTMGAPTDFPVDEGGLHQAVGDMNGDNIPDVVQVGDNGQVSVLLGKGDGTFFPYQAFYCGYQGGYPAVALGDFNGDGKPDVAVVIGGTGQGRTSIMLGNGDGTLQAPMVLATPAPDADVLAVGDLRSDGKVDLIIPLQDASGAVAVLLNTRAAPQCVGAGTCNGDGTCSFANLPNGTACNDGNACTQADQCAAGVCSGTPLTCPGANATEACSAGSCSILSCASGYADCDQQAADGCEVDITSSPANCGSCGNACPGSQICAQGACAAAPPPGPGANRVVAGEIHSLAIAPDGTVWASGYGGYGALGNGTLNDSDVPVQATGLTGAISLATGDEHSFALKSDGTVWSWGTGYGPTQLTPLQVAGFSGGTAIAGNYHHVVALRSDGTVWAWGDNSYGQLGNPAAGGSSATPVQATGVSGMTAVAAGLFHTMALRSDGTVWVWGNNDAGELGNGTTTLSTTAIQVMGVSGVASIAAGGFSCYALKSDGTLWAWGDGSFGELADGANADSSVPVQITTISNVTSIASGDEDVLALKSDGTVWTWGRNDFGQLGDGTTTNRNLPVQAIGLTGVTALAPGFGSSLVTRSDGTVWGWGLNDWGQLADGTTITPRPVPEQSLLP
jgi:alpha-tubulin suppressor-like RCC1 family protein